MVHFERGEVERARECAEECVDLGERLGFPFYLSWARAFRAWARIEAAEGAAGLEEIQRATVELARIGSGAHMPLLHLVHADCLSKVGRRHDALEALDLGIARAAQHEQRYYDAELHRLRAEILLDMDGNAIEEAEALFGHSLEIARRQEAKTFELRTAMGLARLWQRQGKRDAARTLLAPLYAWFTEGFDTRDLKDARALLEELGG